MWSVEGTALRRHQDGRAATTGLGAWILGNWEAAAQHRPVQGSRKAGDWKALGSSRISPLARFLITD